MRPAQVRIVEDVDVALLETLSVLNRGCDRLFERAEVRSLVSLSVGNQVPFSCEEGA